MDELNLPQYDAEVKRTGDTLSIYDNLRKKFVVLTPEEWVRQHFLNFLIHHKNYPAGLISVERGVKQSSVINRTDIVVYNRFGNPWMIVECKAPEVEIDNSTFYQALRYHLKLNALYLCVTNGLEHFCVNLKEEQFQFMEDLPEYEG